MITSMTGYGRAEASEDGVTASAEVRTLNSRYLEMQLRLPRSLAAREGEFRELVRGAIARGKVTLNVSVDRDGSEELPVALNPAAAQSVYAMLGQLRTALGIAEPVTLAHVLQFSDVLAAEDGAASTDLELRVAMDAARQALAAMTDMRRREGGELARDIEQRIRTFDDRLARIETLQRGRVDERRQKLHARVRDVLGTAEIDERRLELEIVLLADKLDITEECVRFRSHLKFALELLGAAEPGGRKLNFLVQELNREVNTIGSKCEEADIARLVVEIKDELEKVREQLQNIE